MQTDGFINSTKYQDSLAQTMLAFSKRFISMKSCSQIKLQKG